MSARGSLTVVGLGLRAIGHLTLDAAGHIAGAERLFHLGSDPLMAGWLQCTQPDGVSLATFYAEDKPRRRTYEEMVAAVMTAVREQRQVVVALYGHPGVGATPAHAMIRQARQEGFAARMLPGISADACLFADLGVDPLTPGTQQYEAWMFMAARPRTDPRFALVLWQIGVLYQHSVSFEGIADPRGMRDLARRLRRSYPADHDVVLYEAATLPIVEPRIERCPLSSLASAAVSPATTLYVPPLTPPRMPRKTRGGRGRVFARSARPA